jgi:hypothetical protein
MPLWRLMTRYLEGISFKAEVMRVLQFYREVHEVEEASVRVIERTSWA